MVSSLQGKPQGFGGYVPARGGGDEMRTRLLCLSVLLGVALTMAVPRTAQAVAISPSSIVEKDVMRGRTITRSLTIFNTGAKDTTYTFEVTGKVLSRWVRVLEPNTAHAITLLEVPAKSSLSVAVEIAVPSTAANGRYRGAVNSVPTVAGAGPKMVLVPSLVLSISVTDKEIIDMQLRTFYVSDVEVGMPLSIVGLVRNSSNVDISPTLRFGIVQGETVLRRAEFDIAGIGVGADGGETFNLAIADMPEGKYRAYGQLSYRGVVSKKQWIDFAVVPAGTFTKALLEGFVVSGQPRLGDTMTATATFNSQSPRALKPRLVVDVLLDGLKIGSVESTEGAIDPYGKVPFSVSMKIQKAGSYRLEGYFAYSGKESNKSSAAFDVTDTRLGYAYGAMAVVAAFLGTTYYYRRRNGHGGRILGGGSRGAAGLFGRLGDAAPNEELPDTGLDALGPRRHDRAGE